MYWNTVYSQSSVNDEPDGCRELGETDYRSNSEHQKILLKPSKKSKRPLVISKRNQMPINGWTKVEQDWVEEQAISNLQFEKADRRASVVLTASSGGDKTTVLITISPK